MYSFIYFYFYKYFQWKGESDPKDAAIYGVMTAVFFHLFFIVTIVNYFFQSNILELAFVKGQSKYIFLPLVILIMVVIHRVYKNKAEKIIEKYKERENFFNWLNSLSVILIVVGPLCLGIYFLNNG